MTPRRVYLNGLFVDPEKARVSIFDRGFLYGDGLFETLRSYGGNPFRLDCHIDRLRASAGRIFLDLPMTARELKSAIEETLSRNRYSDAVIRVNVSRGEQPPGLRLDSAAPPTVAITVRPLEPVSQQLYQTGASVALFPRSAVTTSGLGSQIKSCNFLSNIIIRELAVRKKVFEGILMDPQGRLAEGTTSNIFLLKDGTLKTPALTPYVLPGVTRKVVLELAADQGLPVREQSLAESDLHTADEVFLTNSVIEILPVTQVDGWIIGRGTPGKITRLLQKAYLKTVEGSF